MYSDREDKEYDQDELASRIAKISKEKGEKDGEADKIYTLEDGIVKVIEAEKDSKARSREQN